MSQSLIQLHFSDHSRHSKVITAIVISQKIIPYLIWMNSVHVSDDKTDMALKAINAST